MKAKCTFNGAIQETLFYCMSVIIIIIAAMFMYICRPYTNEKAYNYIHVSG